MVWLKLPGPHFHPLTENEGGLFVLPRCEGRSYEPGIYRPGLGPDDEPQMLIRFANSQHAAESLNNLFLVWARHPDIKYLTPSGNTWIPPDLNKPKAKE